MKASPFKPLSEDERALVRLILQSKLTRAKIAEVAGVARSTVDRFVNGTRIAQEYQDKIRAAL